MALQASLRSTIECVKAFSRLDYREDMKQITVPTLIIHGDDDQIVPFEATGALTAKLVPGAVLKVYAGAPHGFAVTHGDQLNADLLSFLQS
ncbi:alpha/beta fold hydrolase [Gluconobacter cerinus]|uniref:alpha/beta fold hydrolase n=1 Tax=Gluconobacter cerinus TaxID=38307 RepID=UPI0022B691C3|nr:alpha/beta hydrolase [Gluconobacter cerinus]